MEQLAAKAYSKGSRGSEFRKSVSLLMIAIIGLGFAGFLLSQSPAAVGLQPLPSSIEPSPAPEVASESQELPSHCGLYAYAAEVTEVYDGDSITANVDLGFKTWRRDEKLRLFGIDAPEVRGKSREAGLKSRDALRSRILGQTVIICTIKDKTGKFGRYLAEVYLNGENINEWLLAQGYASPYLIGVQSSLTGNLNEMLKWLTERFAYSALDEVDG